MNNLDAIPWYRSPQQIGLVTTAVSALIALFPKIGKMLGWNTPDDVSAGVTSVFGVIAVIAPIIGTFIRAKSTVQPLTLTKAAAEAHPNTVANAQAAASEAFAKDAPQVLIVGNASPNEPINVTGAKLGTVQGGAFKDQEKQE